MENSRVIQKTFVVNYRPWIYRRPGPLYHSSTLYVCEDDNPPAYQAASGWSSISLSDLMIVVPLCSIKVDLRNLPSGAFQRRVNHGQQCFQATYSIGLTFGPELILKFLYQREVMGIALANYF